MKVHRYQVPTCEGELAMAHDEWEMQERIYIEGHGVLAWREQTIDFFSDNPQTIAEAEKIIRGQPARTMEVSPQPPVGELTFEDGTPVHAEESGELELIAESVDDDLEIDELPSDEPPQEKYLGTVELPDDLVSRMIRAGKALTQVKNTFDESARTLVDLLNASTTKKEAAGISLGKPLDLDDDLIDNYIVFDHLDGLEFRMRPDNPYLDCIRAQKVPQEIVQKGDEAVWNYARTEIRKLWVERKKVLVWEAGIRKNPKPVSVNYEGIILKGRIVEATSSSIKVKLDKPLEGEFNVNYGFGSAMSHEQAFTKEGQITPEGYIAAKQALHQAYKLALKKPESDMAERLNKRNEAMGPEISL